MITCFEDLEVWQQAHTLVLDIYQVTQPFPDTEKFGLVSQMRRSAVSVPANIAEGFKRKGLRDKVHFYNISQSSLEEVRYYCILSKDLKLISDNQWLLSQTQSIGKMLTALIATIERKTRP